MELKNMLSGLENLKVKGSLDIDISKIKNDSKEVSENDVFVALTGFNFDGHEYIEEAVKNGAKAVVMQEDKIDKNIIQKIPSEVTIVVVPDTRYALAIMACNYY